MEKPKQYDTFLMNYGIRVLYPNNRVLNIIPPDPGRYQPKGLWENVVYWSVWYWIKIRRFVRRLA